MRSITGGQASDADYVVAAIGCFNRVAMRGAGCLRARSESSITVIAPQSFSGEWSGSTSQGRPLAFTVSADHVTAVTVGYGFGGCSGSKADSNLNAEIADLRNSPQPPPSPYFFAALLGPYSESDNTQIQGFFDSPRMASGLVVFERSGCGEAFATWTATKR